MKKYLAIAVLVALSISACKSKQEQKEEERVDSVVKETIKTEKEKSDSALEYWKKKMDSSAHIQPEMPEMPE